MAARSVFGRHTAVAAAAVCAISLAAAAQPHHTKAKAEPLIASPVAAAVSGDAAAGALLYEQRCTSCHALDVNRIGPMHRGVVGRRAGSVAGFKYSSALRASGLVWGEANLDKWLAGPTTLVPMTRMGLITPLAEDRRNIIAYLRKEGAQTR
jgi:cytochrome c